MKVVILAGGKGTRIASVNREIPKAMIPVCGKPVLEYQIELARRYGYTDILLVIGYLGEKIRSYFGDGSRFGVSISYYVETTPLGTAGALAELRPVLTDDFFLFYGDTVMDIALDQMLCFHRNHGGAGTLLLHPNDHPYDSDLVEITNEGKVSAFHSKPHVEGWVYRNLVNAALYILTPRVVDFINRGIKSDFGKDIFPACLKAGLPLFGYVSTEYIKDMGTPERYEKVCRDMWEGKVARRNRSYARSAVFLDRDGVVSKEVNLLCRVDQLELIEGVAEAINYIHEQGYLAIILTNQPVIARNLCTLEELEVIHKKLETLLGSQGSYVDAIYYCPHHPDAGYPEERKEYKIVCECRKPRPGMLLQAAKDWHIDLSSSYMIGDRESDRQAGENAGVKASIVIEQNKPFALLETVHHLI